MAALDQKCGQYGVVIRPAVRSVVAEFDGLNIKFYRPEIRKWDVFEFDVGGLASTAEAWVPSVERAFGETYTLVGNIYEGHALAFLSDRLALVGVYCNTVMYFGDNFQDSLNAICEGRKPRAVEREIDDAS